jgi:PAS domain S-box-containing protein
LVAVAVIWLGYRRSMIEREMSAQAVAEERERLQVTLLGIGDGVIAIDASGRITFMNPVSEALTGWRQPEAVGKQVTDVFRIVNEDTRQRVQNPLALVLSEGTIQRLANHTILIARDGTERPIDDSAAPLRDVAGRVVGGVLIFRDVSQRRADDRRLREALDRAEESTRLAEARQRELEEALNVKNQFLAAVSHELRTPINSIVGWATMLQQGTMRSERAGAGIASIERNAQALAHLIEDLLESSRLLTGKMSLTTEDVVLDRVIGAAVDAIQLTADNKNVALDVHADVVPNVRGDADRLKQVFWNILGNAIKFTPPGGRVNVRITREQEFVAVSVTDTGEGIEPAFLAHVFDNFRQADSRSRGGLGLGLAIARQVVELHGGTIHASSDGANQGARFIVRLPAVPAVI